MKTTAEIEIQRQAYGGYGVGFYDNKAVFIPRAVTGDICLAALDDTGRKHYFSEKYELLQPSSDRIKPPCPNFGLCGGCSYQNIKYETEVKYKADIINYNLSALAGLKRDEIPETNIIPSPERFYYRSHISVKSDNKKTGFYEKGSNSFVPFPEQGCIIAAREINDALNEISPGFSGKDIRLAVDSSGKVFYKTGSRLTEVVNDIIYERDISDFFQSNRYLRETMLKTAAEYASEASVLNSFLDLGCGVGFFTLYLGKNLFNSGWGVDISSSSIKSAEKNLKHNNIENVFFINASGSSVYPEFRNSDVVVVDPPRGGIAKKAKQGIAAISPEIILYISCSPATFARDTRDFYKNGYYMTKLSMIDMFPMTHHIEVISLFRKN